MPPEASQDEIKHAFRRLALRLHPDKLVGASDEDTAAAAEKFKEVNSAYSLLSDAAKRERYNRTGTTSDDDDDDEGADTVMLSPADLINMAFGTQTIRHYRSFGAEPPLAFGLVQLVPAVLLLFSAVVPPRSASAAYPDTAAPFRLHADVVFDAARATASGGVPYYVKPDFADEIGRDGSAAVRAVEAAVESVARAVLRASCDEQRRARQAAIDAARRLPKGEKEERDAQVAAAQARSSPACAELAKAFGEERASALAFRRQREPPLPWAAERAVGKSAPPPREEPAAAAARAAGGATREGAAAAGAAAAAAA